MTEQQYLIATQRAIDELARQAADALAPAEYVHAIHDIGAAILAKLAGDDDGDMAVVEPDDDDWYAELNSSYMRDIGAGLQRWTR